ncbi:MAG: 23S rRNA (pseudouridine(1915)-N(3))-methyltransferase RlmH [Alphaproteobacteria bacterium]|nr:23S rRNA (pseudouridine(1915)-N(3))-methyltransferase RlmH [Alphaproteobacteria bacterium]
MHIQILSPGKFENSPHKEVFAHYHKRMKWKIELKELAQGTKEEEQKLILKNLKPATKLIALDERGQEFSSTNFAKLISDFALHGNSHLSFLIGGAEGLTDDILKKSSLKISLGKMTLPHLMARTILLEQLYRAQSILAGHPYHRES